MKLLTAISSVAIPGWAMFVQKEPQGVRSALLETSSELREMIQGYTGDPTGDLLGNVAKMITDTMMPGILSAHNSTQHQLVAFGQAFSTCPSPTTSSQAYHLARIGADSCDTGSTPAEEECEAAADELVQALGKTQGRQGLVAGSWGHVPVGCSVQSKPGSGDWAAHFNRNPKGANKDSYSVVCSGKACDWTCYLNRYPDLVKAFGTDLNAAQNHYKVHGKKEKRDCTCGAQGAAMLLQRESSLSVAVQSTTISTTVLGDAQWIAATMGTLAQCRQREGATDTEHKKCLQDLSVLEGVKNSTCNSLKALKTAPVDTYLCTPTDPYEQWLTTAKGKTTALKASLLEKEAGCGNATTMFNDKVPTCDALKLQLDGNKTECDQLQGQTEAGMCSGPVALQRGQCEDYSKCYDAALAAYQDEKPTIEEMHLNWTVQWRTLKRMDCLLGIMQAGGTNDDIDKCKEKLWPTDHLDLAYPIIPDKEKCGGAAGGAGTTFLQISQTTGAIPLPCEADFVTKYYGSNPLGAPAAACTPCSPLDGTDGTTATTTPAAVSSPKFGGNGGGEFAENRKAEGKVISRVCIWHGSMIDAVQLWYWSGENPAFDNPAFKSEKYGGCGGGETCLSLDRHEEITKVVVHAGSMVDGIEMTTSKGKVEKWGGTGGGRNDFEMAGMHLIGISGRKGASLDAFGVIFGA